MNKIQRAKTSPLTRDFGKQCDYCNSHTATFESGGEELCDTCADVVFFRDAFVQRERELEIAIKALTQVCVSTDGEGVRVAATALCEIGADE